MRELVDADFHEGNDGIATGSLITVISRSLSDLERMWPSELDGSRIPEIGRLLASDERSNYWTIVGEHIPALEDAIDDYFSSQPYSDMSYAILDLLHPRVVAASYTHFKTGSYRDAVLNSIVALFDFIRERTGLDLDGSALVTESFSIQRPMLLMSSLDSENGRNDQLGFIHLLQGLYQGVRNPKAHTLTINPSENVAAQYLVFSSLLCRRVEGAELVENGGRQAE